MTVKRIGTHSGTFHCDEILAVAMLKQLPEYKHAEVVRSRDPAVLAGCDIVVDVGAEFDAERHRYDHHQASFNLTMTHFHPNLKPDVKLSSAGLVFAHFGKRVISEVGGVSLKDKPDDVDAVFKAVYKNFVSEVDAIDNGVPIAPVTPTYAIHTGLSGRVGACNPSWNKPDEDEMDCFNKAYKMVEAEFIANVLGLVDNWLPARSIVKEAIESRHSVHPSGLIVSLTHQSCPWKSHFFHLEKELLNHTITSGTDFRQRPCFMLMHRKEEFSVVCIPVSPDAPFSKRVPMVASWGGLRDEALTKVCGISGSVFVHSNLFLGISKTQEGALEMALKSLKAVGYL